VWCSWQGERYPGENIKETASMKKKEDIYIPSITTPPIAFPGQNRERPRKTKAKKEGVKEGKGSDLPGLLTVQTTGTVHGRGKGSGKGIKGLHSGSSQCLTENWILKKEGERSHL